MANETKKPSKDQVADLVELERVASDYSLRVLENTAGRFERALQLAEGMTLLRHSVMPLMPKLMPLQNTPLGFLTDKAQGGYPESAVCECLVEAVLRGCYPVGNEFNIIAGRCYVTKQGYARLVRELPRLTDLSLKPGVPNVVGTGGALVPYTATWLLDGKPQRYERLLRKLPDGTQVDERIPVRVQGGAGADNIIGKATRKMLAAIYAKVTGSEQTGVEGEVGDAELVLPAPGGRTAEVAARLAQQAGNGAPAVTMGEPVAEAEPAERQPGAEG